MKTSARGFSSILILVVVVVLGAAAYLYFGPHTLQLPPVSITATSTQTGSSQATTTTSAENKVVTSTSTPQMLKYTDTTFGYSFWYPENWTVTDSVVDNKNADRTYATGAHVVRTLHVQDPKHVGVGVTINEVSSPNMSIYGDPLDDPSPVGFYENYYFDTSLHTWMVTVDRTPTGKGQGTTAADVSNNTMGGLHIFSGYRRFSEMNIVPLSATHFLALYDDYNSAGIGASVKDPYQAFSSFVHTIVATDPDVATPLDQETQDAYVATEAAEYSGNAMTIRYLTSPHSMEFSDIPPSAGEERFYFGDGKMQGAGPIGNLPTTVSHTYASKGYYTVTLYRSLPSIPLEIHTILVP
jgi:hypothetical protein